MKYFGNPVSEGIALGKIMKYKPKTVHVVRNKITSTETAAAIERYFTARSRAEDELAEIIQKMEESTPDKAKIFAAHQQLVTDIAIEEEILDCVEENLIDSDWAIETVYEKLATQLEKVGDALIQERAYDLRDVKNRLLRCWYKLEESNLAALGEPVIVMAHDLLPSDTATIDRDNVLAIVTEIGSNTSHSAIIARSYGIPALLGVEKCMDMIPEDAMAIVDAVEGSLNIYPDEHETADAMAKRAAFLQKQQELAQYLPGRCTTADGQTVEIELNLAAPTEEELSYEAYCDGVGLFRTEFLYMGRTMPPTEDEQCAVYKRVLQKFKGKPVVLRTLDIGGDKRAECLEMPMEENTFLGNRALRYCLAHLDIFRTQLRACLRASVFGELWIMFPMVACVEDLRSAKEALDAARAELRSEGIPYSDQVRVGVMIEIPSAALMAEQLAEESDFASIGTNDLTQYTLAVDRMNPMVLNYYRAYHPALFKLIGAAASAYNKRGKPVAVCGEMAADPTAVLALTGLGIRRLSMGHSAIAQVKKTVSRLRIPDAELLTAELLKLGTEAEARALLKKN